MRKPDDKMETFKAFIISYSPGFCSHILQFDVKRLHCGAYQNNWFAEGTTKKRPFSSWTQPVCMYNVHLLLGLSTEHWILNNNFRIFQIRNEPDFLCLFVHIRLMHAFSPYDLTNTEHQMLMLFYFKFFFVSVCEMWVFIYISTFLKSFTILLLSSQTKQYLNCVAIF